MSAQDESAFPDFAESFDEGAKELADSMLRYRTPSLAKLLSDPIVQAVMAADGVRREQLWDQLRDLAARLGLGRRSGPAVRYTPKEEM